MVNMLDFRHNLIAEGQVLRHASSDTFLESKLQLCILFKQTHAQAAAIANCIPRRQLRFQVCRKRYYKQQYDTSYSNKQQIHTHIAQGYTNFQGTFRSNPADVSAKYFGSEPVNSNQALVSKADLTVCLKTSPQ